MTKPSSHKKQITSPPFRLNTVNQIPESLTAYLSID